MHSLAHKPKLGHYNIAESLNRYQRLKKNPGHTRYIEVTIIETVLGDSFPRGAYKFIPFPGALTITGYTAVNDSPFPGLIPNSAQSNAG